MLAWLRRLFGQVDPEAAILKALSRGQPMFAPGLRERAGLSDVLTLSQLIAVLDRMTGQGVLLRLGPFLIRGEGKSVPTHYSWMLPVLL